MKTMYKVNTCFTIPFVDKVEIERETEHFVYYSENRREEKITRTYHYFDTFEDAHAYMLHCLKHTLEIALSEVAKYEAAIQKLSRIDQYTIALEKGYSLTEKSTEKK